MEFGRAGTVLQRIGDWKEAPAVIWLDYDGILSRECLSDLEYVASNASSGTVLIISVNAGKMSLHNASADDGSEIDGDSLSPLQILERNIDRERVPLGLGSRDLSGWSIASTYRTIIDAAIRNGLTLHPEDKFSYEQIYNFTYTDGAKMLTVGGVLFSENDREKFENAGFSNMDFVRQGVDSYRIDPPKLTYVEMRAINSQNSHSPNLPIPPGDIEKFKKTYRYFPHFIEAEVG